MVDIDKLKTELTTDPLERGYAGMDADTAAWSLNMRDRKRDKTSLTASEVLQAIVPDDLVELSDTDQRRVWDVLHMGTINPFGVEATIFASVFGTESATITALKLIRAEQVSRAEELGFSSVVATHITHARAYHDS